MNTMDQGLNLVFQTVNNATGLDKENNGKIIIISNLNALFGVFLSSPFFMHVLQFAFALSSIALIVSLDFLFFNNNKESGIEKINTMVATRNDHR